MPPSDDESLDLEKIFTVSLLVSLELYDSKKKMLNLRKEPSRPPSPRPTIAKYIRDSNQIHSPDDWKEIEIRLVGTHPLWGHYLCVSR